MAPGHCRSRHWSWGVVMQIHTRPFVTGAVVVLCSLSVLAAGAAAEDRTADAAVRPLDAASLRRIGEMMAELRAESRRDAERIEAAYGHVAGSAGLRDRDALAASFHDGYVAALPADTRRFNVRPRLEGAHPIGEKDLANQPLYVAARPATLGLLFHVAARVPAPLEVTSLVRHHAYQRALQRSNPNARTAVPTHALGLAFDISVLYATPEDAAATRDVLRRMRDDGALYFIAERHQLVFHVVPRPERLDHYANVFAALTQVPAPVRAGIREALPAVRTPPPPDTAWLDALDERRPPPVSLGVAALVGSLAASGVGASLNRRRSRPVPFLRA